MNAPCLQHTPNLLFYFTRGEGLYKNSTYKSYTRNTRNVKQLELLLEQVLEK